MEFKAIRLVLRIRSVLHLAFKNILAISHPSLLVGYTCHVIMLAAALFLEHHVVFGHIVHAGCGWHERVKSQL